MKTMHLIKSGFLTILFVLNFTAVQAQIEKRNIPKIQFQSSFQSGLLFGQTGSKVALTVNVVNGFKFNGWFGGLGFGIDYYGKKRAVPLFLTLQKDISSKINTLFLYGNIGYNLAWLKADEKMILVQNYKQSGGLFFDAGVGYKFKIYRKNMLGLSTGYALKQIIEKYSYGNACLSCRYYIPAIQSDIYKFRTIAIKINWWFM